MVLFYLYIILNLCEAYPYLLMAIAKKVHIIYFLLAPPHLILFWVVQLQLYGLFEFKVSKLQNLLCFVSIATWNSQLCDYSHWHIRSSNCWYKKEAKSFYIQYEEYKSALLIDVHLFYHNPPLKRQITP